MATNQGARLPEAAAKIEAMEAGMRATAVAIAVMLAATCAAQDQPPESTPYRMEIPSGLRAWYRNPDG